VGGTKAITNTPLFGAEQWLEIGAMDLDYDGDYKTIEI
jgi:hypothetical protein